MEACTCRAEGYVHHGTLLSSVALIKCDYCKSLPARVALLMEELAALRTASTTDKYELMKQVADLQEKLASALKALQDTENSEDELEAECADLKERLRAAEENVAGWKRENEYLKKTLAAPETPRYAKLLGENANLKADNTALQQEVERLKAGPKWSDVAPQLNWDDMHAEMSQLKAENTALREALQLACDRIYKEIKYHVPCNPELNEQPTLCRDHLLLEDLKAALEKHGPER